MIRSMKECGPPLTYQDVENLETRLDVSLPTAYKDFLLQYNGGRPSPDAFPIEGLTNNPFGVIQVFFRIGGPIKSSTLDWNRRIMQERMAPELFPIACTGCGDFICVVLNGQNAGSVVFWDAHGDVNGPYYGLTYRIADTFIAFIDELCDLPEDRSR